MLQGTKLFGHYQTHILRWMARHNWTVEEAKGVFRLRNVKAFKDESIQTIMSAAKPGNSYEKAAAAELTLAEESELESLRQSLAEGPNG